MRIKHYAGYGSVNAKVVERVNDPQPNWCGRLTKSITINVWGNHERGLIRKDAYDVNKWLLKKVARVDIPYMDMVSVLCETIPNIDGQEAVRYKITYVAR